MFLCSIWQIYSCVRAEFYPYWVSLSACWRSKTNSLLWWLNTPTPQTSLVHLWGTGNIPALGFPPARPQAGIPMLWDLSPLQVRLTHSASWGIKELCQSRASFATSEHHVCWRCKIAEEFNNRSFQNVHHECTKDSPKWVSSWPGELSGWEITSGYSAFAFHLLRLFPRWLTWAKAVGVSLPSLRQLCSARVGAHLEGLPVMTSDTLPHLGILYEEALGPSILAESPHPHPTPQTSATSCLGGLMLEVQA